MKELYCFADRIDWTSVRATW